MFLFLCITTSGLMRASVFAQTTVTAKFRNVTLNEVLWEIQKQTDFTFIYSTNDAKKVRVENLSDRLVYHRVKSGDTLGKIARIYGTSVNELCRLNGLKSTSVLRIGQSIRCSAGAVTSAKAGTSKPAASASVKQTVKTTVAADAAAVASINQTADAGRQEATPVYHRVKSGDTLGAIAAKYGTTVSKLCELNGITKTTILKLGRSLRCS